MRILGGRLFPLRKPARLVRTRAVVVLAVVTVVTVVVASSANVRETHLSATTSLSTELSKAIGDTMSSSTFRFHLVRSSRPGATDLLDVSGEVAGPRLAHLVLTNASPAQEAIVDGRTLFYREVGAEVWHRIDGQLDFVRANPTEFLEAAASAADTESLGNGLVGFTLSGRAAQRFTEEPDSRVAPVRGTAHIVDGLVYALEFHASPRSGAISVRIDFSEIGGPVQIETPSAR